MIAQGGAAGDPTGELRIRALLTELLDALGLGRPVDPAEFCERLGVHLGRPVRLEGRRFPTAHASGAAVRITEPSEAYVVAYQAATTPGHQAHIVFHEVMHILCGHLDRTDEDGSVVSCRWVEDAREPTGDIAPSGDAAAQLMEWEAETGATILSGWSRSNPAKQAEMAGDRRVQRFASALLGAPWT